MRITTVIEHDPDEETREAQKIKNYLKQVSARPAHVQVADHFLHANTTSMRSVHREECNQRCFPRSKIRGASEEKSSMEFGQYTEAREPKKTEHVENE
ncbi:hypothetical protein ElyMa_005466800 [Elysia marginata]|uniref:Uncharacterized protein n=1 Tax=Elysia marginata TaxID=1093978 RepID=A0AAV4EQ14_9GAST|nr:hypothetical protein ElyMa_005466800 [Elysia marginata]